MRMGRSPAITLFSECQSLLLRQYIDGLVQERRNSSAMRMELCLSCTKPSICLLDSENCGFSLQSCHTDLGEFSADLWCGGHLNEAVTWHRMTLLHLTGMKILWRKTMWGIAGNMESIFSTNSYCLQFICWHSYIPHTVFPFHQFL